MIQRLTDENRGLAGRVDQAVKEASKPIDPTRLSKGDAIAIARVHLPHLLDPIKLKFPDAQGRR